MLKLSEADLMAINAMKDFGLFIDVEPHKLHDITEPTGMVMCSDAHQRKDINSHLSTVWKGQDAEESIHEFKDNGLPLMAVNSKIIDPTFKRHLLLLHSIKDAISLGKIKSRIINLGHYPCGIGCKHNLSLNDSVELMVRSRDYITKALPDYQLNFTVNMQVDYRSIDCGKQQNTYHIETSAWTEYANSVDYKPADSLLYRSATAR